MAGQTSLESAGFGARTADASPLPRWPPWSSAGAKALLHRIAREEAERLALWAPVLFGLGCAIGLGPAVAAPLWASLGAAFGLGLLAAGLGIAAARSGRRAPAIAAGAAVAASLIGMGVSATGAKIRAVAAPVAPAFLGVAEIDGWVTAIDRGPSGPRLTLREIPAPPVGTAVRCRAFLQPPPGPVLPGGYDFQRRAFFDRLGGVGAVRGPCEAIELGPPP
jgi:competence protein ComEC